MGSQALRVGDWKGVRNGVGTPLELYDLAQDIGETTDVAAQHPDVVSRIEQMKDEAYVPSPDYRVGEIYTPPT